MQGNIQTATQLIIMQTLHRILHGYIHQRKNTSAIAEHVWHEEHWINCEAAEILDSSQHWYPRGMIEL